MNAFLPSAIISAALAITLGACGGVVDSEPDTTDLDPALSTSGLRDGIVGRSKCKELGGVIGTDPLYTKQCKSLGGTGEICTLCNPQSTMALAAPCDPAVVCVK